ncbi:MAG: hypothetical protein U5M50_00985 [Sphingobium sp.]|nr:hypothetical protein [Sphingobium sp.]
MRSLRIQPEPLGSATQDIQNRLNGFVLDIGKINLQGLTGEEIEEKLSAVFGAAADDMAKAAFPGMEKFQQVGEEQFETLVRVASTVESVTSSLTMLGSAGKSDEHRPENGACRSVREHRRFHQCRGWIFPNPITARPSRPPRATAQLGDVFGTLGLAMPQTRWPDSGRWWKRRI